MSELTLQTGDAVRSVPVPVRQVQAGAPPAIPRATPDPGSEFFRPFGNYRQNSRAPGALPSGEWSVRWKGELEPSAPVFVIEAKDRFLVQSEVWRLFDREGGLIARNVASGAPMAMDSQNGLFYGIDRNNYIAAYHLDTGQLLFRTLPDFGGQYSRIHLARHGNGILAVGTQRGLDPHRKQRPTRSLVELRGLGTPPTPDYMGFLASAVPLGTLYIPHPRVVAASSDDAIAVARPDLVYILDWNLSVRTALEGTFEPRAISLDERGNIYLLTGPETGARALMALQPDGTRLYTFELPAGVVAKPVPPIVGYDHTVYLQTATRIYAIGGNGKRKWVSDAHGSIAGAVITADDTLLVTEGSEIVSYNSTGERKVLFQGEQFLTPPLLSAHGEILAASRTSLFCLAAK